MNRAARWAALCGFVVIASGCSRDPAPPPPPDKMTDAVYRIADDAQNAERFKKLFVDGAVPDEKQRPQYAKAMFTVLETTPAGETQAELKVRVTDFAGQTKGEIQWTVVNDHGSWKLKNAPLP